MTHSKPNSLPLSLFGFEARQHVFLQRRQQLLHHHVGHHLELTDTENISGLSHHHPNEARINFYKLSGFTSKTGFQYFLKNEKNKTKANKATKTHHLYSDIYTHKKSVLWNISQTYVRKNVQQTPSLEINSELINSETIS